MRLLISTGDATIAVVNGVLQIFNYDAYGSAVGFSLSAAATTLLYSGEQTDAVTGTQHLGIRDERLATGTYLTSDDYGGDRTSPIGYNKYLYTNGDPINGYDPSGRDLVEVLGVLTIGATVGSLVIPAVGVAYLAAQGKVDPWGVYQFLLQGQTWNAAAVALVGGAGLSIAAQAAILRIAGKEAAKKLIPGVGLLAAVYGLWQSIQITTDMVTGKLPPRDVEQYCAVMIAASVEASLLGGLIYSIKNKGAANDAAYWASSREDQAIYNEGQALLSDLKWNELEGKGLTGQTYQDVMNRGRALQTDFADGGLLAERLSGAADMLKASAMLGRGGGMPVWKWISSGLTPELRFVFGDNAWTIIAAIDAGAQRNAAP